MYGNANKRSAFYDMFSDKYLFVNCLICDKLSSIFLDSSLYFSCIYFSVLFGILRVKIPIVEFFM
jgi:hypothetical protein